MAAKEMLANIVLGGRTTSGFDALAGKVSALGAALNGMSERAWEFEKESVETYKNYETYMLEAEGALTAQYTSASELARVMAGLEENAQYWAETTIFDTQDMAKSISEAAHAGWDYEQMILGIPEAMLLAQAGNMDLSTALNYVIKTLNATKTPFEDAGALIDQWAMAANSGATDIGELGEAMLRMGATARFADNTEELFTMLAVLADAGTVGAEAGTLLRNSMIRLIAPTEKASEAMASLGITYEEAQEIAADDGALKKANRLLETAGFSAYDSTGKLKPFLEIYKELHAAVKGMSEEDANTVLSAIFPTRTITGALTLLDAATTKFDALYAKISNSDGYADRIAEIQTSGLMGAMEELDSKWESFQLKFGQTAAPGVEIAADALGGMLDTVNAWPEETFAGLVGGVTTIAAAGPTLLAIGGAMKMISTFGITGTLAIAGLAATVSALSYAAKQNQLEFEGLFGELALDVDELGAYADSLTTKFDAEAAALTEWSNALETAQTEYSELATLLAEDMLTAVLTGKELSDLEKQALFDYGKGITDAALAGIQSAKDTDMTFLDMLFGDMSTDEEKQAFIDSVGWTDDYYDGLYSEAYAIGETIRNQMTAALQDGSLNEAERQAIQSSIDRLNEIEAEINKQMSEVDFYAQLYKAQRVSWDTIDEYTTENAEKQAEELEKLDELYADLWGHQKAAYEYAVEQASSDAERAELEDKWEKWEAKFKDEYDAAINSTNLKYGELGSVAFESAMNDSDLKKAWELLKATTGAETNTGDIDWASLEKEGELYEGYTADLVELKKAKRRLYKKATEIGNETLLDLLDQIPDVLASAFEYEDRRYDYKYEGIDLYNEFSTTQQREALAGEFGTTGEEINAALMEGYGEPLLGAEVDEDGIVSASTAASASGVEALEAEWGHPVLSASVSISGISGLNTAIRNAGGTGAGTGSISNTMHMYAKGGRATEASIFGEAGPEWAIPEEHSMRTAALLNEAREASGFTWDELMALPDDTPGRDMPQMAVYAVGGRATEASIFGEAGPEWAIPEEHSMRTAALLDAAREASGFTWGELISRSGGLNANTNHQPVQVTYAPTIHANDAAGVEKVLEKDKDRLMRMLRELAAEISLRDDVEVYV